MTVVRIWRQTVVRIMYKQCDPGFVCHQLLLCDMLKQFANKRTLFPPSSFFFFFVILGMFSICFQANFVPPSSTPNPRAWYYVISEDTKKLPALIKRSLEILFAKTIVMYRLSAFRLGIPHCQKDTIKASPTCFALRSQDVLLVSCQDGHEISSLNATHWNLCAGNFIAVPL